MPTYRPEALARLSSPDQLHQLMTVTNPLGWLALLTTGIILLSTLGWSVLGRLPISVKGPGILLQPQALEGVISMAGGQVVEVLVEPGQLVARGALVARLQPVASFPRTARLDILSPFAGRVAEVLVKPGAFVQPGEALVNLTSEVSELEAYLFLPLDQGKKIRPGMTAKLAPSTVEEEEFGYLVGQVRLVSEYNSTHSELVELLGSEELADVMTGGSRFQAAPLLVKVRLIEDLTTPSGFRWSSKQGPPFGLRDGTLLSASIVTEFQRPIDMVIPYLDKVLGASPW